MIYGGTQDLSNGLTLEIETGSERSCDGIKGTIRRLQMAHRYADFATPGRNLHGTERISIEAAQIGNRISRHPELFEQEVDRMPQLVSDFKAMLDMLEHRQHDRRKPKTAEYCQKARAILSESVQSVKNKAFY